MKPGIIVIPDSVKSVAILNMNQNRSDSNFIYTLDQKNIDDTSIRYRDLSNNCTEALTNHLKKSEYFSKASNFGDSLYSQWYDGTFKTNPDKFYEKVNADMYLFLNYLGFENSVMLTSYPQSFYTIANLTWTIVYRNDTLVYYHNQTDTLFYNDEQFRQSFKGKNKPKLAFMMASEHLGDYFGSKILPTWNMADRLYYGSNNLEMLRAEKYALANDWFKAAELWRLKVNNPNYRMAAKACYNMALVCEMEGKPDLAIDWLVQSYSKAGSKETEHKANCQRYINLLTNRKKEIELLSRQVRTNY